MGSLESGESAKVLDTLKRSLEIQGRVDFKNADMLNCLQRPLQLSTYPWISGDRFYCGGQAFTVTVLVGKGNRFPWDSEGVVGTLLCHLV